MSNNFSPREHLIMLKSKQGSSEYLPVQWRLVWFRQECPEGTIETEIIHLDLEKETEEETYTWNSDMRRSEKLTKTARGLAIVRAIVKDGKGGVSMGTKMEKAASFGDWLEKAETGAIGRALAALGYGTQFTGDEFDEQHRIVDAPVERKSAAQVESSNEPRPVVNGRTGASNGRARVADNGKQKGEEEVDPEAPATEQQWASIRNLCQRLGKAEPQVADSMTYLGAKELIAQLSQEYRQSRKLAS